MSKAKCFPLAAAAMAFFLSCSDELKPIERETWEDYQRTLSSSGGAANPSSSSEGTNLSSSSEAANPSSSGEEQKAAVSGVSQKGPFLNNSSVTLYELGSNLVQTGRSFHGTTDEKGGFEIKGIELASPYALLKADGFYRNEVTGENSSAPITLYAIADMGGKSSANVNILTHLEYYRVQELAKGRSLAEAKKQALGEILAVFGIDGSGFKGSEEMSVFGTGDADAALLAISILLQGDLSEGSFLALLADFSQKLKDGGVWDSKAKKAEMAEWASSADLDAIRGNIDGWGLSESVPDFEKYIRSYAEANSPKGGCKPSENEFCYNERIYDKCGDGDGMGKHEYDPVTQFCHNNYTVAKCGGKEYLPPDERCSYGVIENRCGTAWYNPAQYFCYNGSDLRSCGNPPLPYNPVAQFCELAKIYDKCGGTVAFAPEAEACCGSVKYTLATHSCHNGQTYSCGDKPYDPNTQFCLGDAITQLCGGEKYESSQFCSGNNIYDKCGGTVTFAPGTEQCCGSGKYTIATQFCYSSSKVGQKCGSRTETYDPDLYQCKPQINSSGIYLKSKPRDAANKEYEAVLIGTQIWMAENLNYNASGSVCHGNNSDNCNTYGRLYNWATAMVLSNCNSAFCSNQIQAKHKGICPSGWHIPSDAEWDELSRYVDSQKGTEILYDKSSPTAGEYLKAVWGWNDSGNGTDDYGFFALGGGYGTNNGNSFGRFGELGAWWSTTEGNDPGGAYFRDMHSGDDGLHRGYYNYCKSELLSVRCVKD